MTASNKRSQRSVNPAHTAIFAASKFGVLTTIKSDGRPQLSEVTYAYDPDTATFSMSVTTTRAKTKNLNRDPRASILVQGPNQWSYAVGEGLAQVGESTTAPGDAASDDLVELYRSIAGEHPDWDEYRKVMVDEKRLVLKVVLDHTYGTG